MQRRLSAASTVWVGTLIGAALLSLRVPCWQVTGASAMPDGVYRLKLHVVRGQEEKLFEVRRQPLRPVLRRCMRLTCTPPIPPQG